MNYGKVIADAAAIAAIGHLATAIGSEKGITFYEDRPAVKAAEIGLSAFAIVFLGKELYEEILSGR